MQTGSDEWQELFSCFSQQTNNPSDSYLHTLCWLNKAFMALGNALRAASDTPYSHMSTLWFREFAVLVGQEPSLSVCQYSQQLSCQVLTS